MPGYSGEQGGCGPCLHRADGGDGEEEDKNSYSSLSSVMIEVCAAKGKV